MLWLFQIRLEAWDSIPFSNHLYSVGYSTRSSFIRFLKVFLFLDWNFQKLNSDSSINPSLSFDCELFLLRNSVSHLFFSARFCYWRRSVRRYLWISWLVFLKLWRFFSAAALLFAFLRVGVWLFSISFAEDSNFSSGTMFVSALLTSVGINSAICFSFLVLYSILRKQPAYYGIYIPRLVAEGKIKQRSDFNLERLIPSANWVKKAWMLSEEELLSSSGLDAVVFMRIVTFR